MTLTNLFVDTTTGSAKFHINTQDVEAAFRTALIAGVTTTLTVLLTVVPNLPANTVNSGNADFTPLFVMVLSFVLRLGLQALSPNKTQTP